MTVVYVHVQVYLEVVICAQQVSAFLIQCLPVHCVDVEQQTDVLPILKLLLKTLSITHCNEVLIFIWRWPFMIYFWRLARADEWRRVEVLWSKGDLQLITCFDNVDTWVEKPLNGVVKRLNIINAVILRLESDDLVPEAEDFLKPVRHSLIESLFCFYLYPLDLVLESERYHLWAFLIFISMGQ